MDQNLTPARLRWLERRRKGIGGSDAAAVMGVSPYKSNLKVWREKVMGYDPQDLQPNKYMEAGTRFEWSLAEWAAERMGVKAVRSRKMHTHPKYPWMIANVDALLPAENAILEIKTAGSMFQGSSEMTAWGTEGTDEVPWMYAAQCQQYMTVLGMKLCYLAVFFHIQREMWIYRLEHNSNTHKALIQMEKKFWTDHVETKVPPTPTTPEDIDAWFDTSSETQARSTVAIRQKIEELSHTTAQIKQMKELQAGLQAEIKLHMAEAGDLLGAYHEIIATWRSHDVERFATKKFREDYPELAAQYLNTSSQRTFRVK